MVIGPYSYSRPLYTRGAILMPRYFFIETVLEGVRKPSIIGVYSRL
jgi:hypothetical protein